MAALSLHSHGPEIVIHKSKLVAEKMDSGIYAFVKTVLLYRFLFLLFSLIFRNRLSPEFITFAEKCIVNSTEITCDFFQTEVHMETLLG